MPLEPTTLSPYLVGLRFSPLPALAPLPACLPACVSGFPQMASHSRLVLSSFCLWTCLESSYWHIQFAISYIFVSLLVAVYCSPSCRGILPGDTVYFSLYLHSSLLPSFQLPKKFDYFSPYASLYITYAQPIPRKPQKERDRQSETGCSESFLFLSCELIYFQDIHTTVVPSSACMHVCESLWKLCSPRFVSLVALFFPICI